MKPTTKRLTVSLLFLLGPTLLVAWLGLSQIGGLEGELNATMSRGTSGLLRGAEREFGEQLEREVRAVVAEMNGQNRVPAQATLGRIAARSRTSGSAVLTAILVAETGLSWWPRVARNTGPTVHLAPSPQGGNAAVTRLLRSVRNAEQFAVLGLFDEALGELQAFDAPLSADGQARLGYEKARLLRKLGRVQEALTKLRDARTTLEGMGRARFRTNTHGLLLMIMLAQAEAQLGLERNKLAEDQDGSLRRRLFERLHRIAQGIADGRFDGVGETSLDYLFDRATGLASEFAENDLRGQLELEECRERNRDRITRRILAAQVRALGLDLSSGPAATGLVARPFYGPAETTLVAFHPVDIVMQPPRKLWLAIQFDPGRLFPLQTAQLEELLSKTGQPFRIELVDADGNSVGTNDDALVGGEREQALALATRYVLTMPLLGFSLLALPRDAAELTRATRRKLALRAGFLLALAVFAGAGALVLVRTVRREGELADMKTRFVGRVSHELKTPLALIRMYGETLAMGRVSDPQKIARFSAVIAKESDRLQGMIDNVLDFSQIEAGTKVYRPVPTRLDVHLTGLLESYRPHLQSHGCDLMWLPLPPVTAAVDPEGLSQAVVNLLSNARKYTIEGGDRRIDVRLKETPQVARIEVLDRGMGVEEADRERIFNTFYRAETAEDRRGSGLGLALVRHFAEAHGGSVVHEPRVGGGSVFRIELPRAEEDGEHRQAE
jgi:signal transduction histidine kinase